jgi:pyruvate dehydrogenase E1 component
MTVATLQPDRSCPDVEISEWLGALDDIIREAGCERAREVLEHLLRTARERGVALGGSLVTPYVNTIATGDQPPLPPGGETERSLEALIRWNAMAMVVGANRDSSELGGHIASYQSAATLYEVGFNHFWRGAGAGAGDLVYIQGHSSPGIYARAFLEGRFEAERLRNFRREVSAAGLSSYPHPWLMPDFWQFPTVSMGLGPLMAIYQARFMRYLANRGQADTAGRRVWAFMGDGEMDEPESVGALSLAGREQLDNLIFVVNCNLQRLDGPVRGNGKVIQELEALFRGAGWNVIKVIWGSGWDPLLAADHEGALRARMDAALDGDYQTYKSRDGAYVREHFFGASPQALRLVSEMSDAEIWALDRGGHDREKVYAAYHAAVNHTGSPTVILAKTIKGHGMGSAGEAHNSTHQQKKLDGTALLAFRDRLELPLSDEQAEAAEPYKPVDDSPELTYLRERRDQLGGALPARARAAEPVPVPRLEAFQMQLAGSGEREISTTMAFVRILAAVIRDDQLGPRVVPIIPDESRTFGMEGMFRQLGIYAPGGQLYTAQDADQLMSYTETPAGQILQEGINEPGAFASWIAAATSYSTHGHPMLPFYMFYSMFGFQRVGDLAWAAGDSRARGFLIGGTAGRTTLNGEGLQHEDGHSHLLASTIPNCRAYDPAFAYELAVIVQHGMQRMLEAQEDAFYYVTVMNENYVQPAIPAGAAEGILVGMHRVRGGGGEPDVRLLGSGTILREALAAADELADRFQLDAEVWSVTSFSELAREGIRRDRANRLHPLREPKRAHVAEALGSSSAPVVAATDYVRAVPEQIRPWIEGPYLTLGTDGFGRSDTRRALRDFFEVGRDHIVLAALNALGRRSDAQRALACYEIDPDTEAPWLR